MIKTNLSLFIFVWCLSSTGFVKPATSGNTAAASSVVGIRVMVTSGRYDGWEGVVVPKPPTIGHGVGCLCCSTVRVQLSDGKLVDFNPAILVRCVESDK